MNENVKLSSLGESKIISEFIKKGFDVFTQFSGKSSIDLVVYKNDRRVGRIGNASVLKIDSRYENATWGFESLTLLKWKVARVVMGRVANLKPS